MISGFQYNISKIHGSTDSQRSSEAFIIEAEGSKDSTEHVFPLFVADARRPPLIGLFRSIA